MNKAVELLYDEHEIIMDAISVAKELRKKIEQPELYEQQVFALISFFREYADKYHHYKEEEILFPEMIKANELLESGVVKEMLDNHEDFRVLIAGIETLTKEKKYTSAQDTLAEYVEALTDHIAVENEEVFEIATTLFSEKELENIYFKFKDIDYELGENNKEGLRERLNKIKKRNEVDFITSDSK